MEDADRGCGLGNTNNLGESGRRGPGEEGVKKCSGKEGDPPDNDHSNLRSEFPTANSPQSSNAMKRSFMPTGKS